tara:strand:+ start:313 stop:459 length:147 start_codon:yes stop_codon:yes gene_type:complete
MNFITDHIFLDDDGTYILLTDNSDCNAPDEWHPIEIGPLEKFNTVIPF